MIIGISGRMGSGKDTLGKAIQFSRFMQRYHQTWEDFPKYMDDADAMKRVQSESGWRVVKFADKLKEIASMLTGIPRTDFERQEVKDRILGPEWSYYQCRFKRDWKLFGPEFTTYKEAEKYERNERTALQWPKTLTVMIEHHDMSVRQLLQKLGTEGLRNGLHQNVWVNALFADYKKIPNHPPGGMGTNGPTYYPGWIITDVRFPNEAQAIKDRGGIMVRIDRPDNPLTPSTHESETALDDWEFDIRVVNNGRLDESFMRYAESILMHENIGGR